MQTPLWRPTVEKPLDRVLTRSQKEIVYVEGREEPVVRRHMSLDAFCRENKDKGDFLVVVMSLQ